MLLRSAQRRRGLENWSFLWLTSGSASTIIHYLFAYGQLTQYIAERPRFFVMFLRKKLSRENCKGRVRLLHAQRFIALGMKWSESLCLTLAFLNSVISLCLCYTFVIKNSCLYYSHFIFIKIFRMVWLLKFEVIAIVVDRVRIKVERFTCASVADEKHFYGRGTDWKLLSRWPCLCELAMYFRWNVTFAPLRARHTKQFFYCNTTWPELNRWLQCLPLLPKPRMFTK